MTKEEAINKLTLLMHDCLEATKMQGAKAKVTFTIPGKWGTRKKKRMYPGGPEGLILAETYDGKGLFVSFNAAKTLTKLEETRNAIITSKHGSRPIDEFNKGIWLGAKGPENHGHRGGAHNQKGDSQRNISCVVSIEPNVLF